MTEMTLKVSNPQGRKVEQAPNATAPRVTDLNGKTIGLLCNWLTGQEEDFAQFKKLLSIRFRNVKFVEWRSEVIAPLDEKGLREVLGPARQCDAVIGFTAL